MSRSFCWGIEGPKRRFEEKRIKPWTIRGVKQHWAWCYRHCHCLEPDKNVYEVQRLLVVEYGIQETEALRISQSFLRNFRKCPESADMTLDLWRLLLWKSALGEQYQDISENVYVQWLHLRYLCLAPPEEVLSLLRSLQKHFCLALITNGPSQSQWEKITKLKLETYFQCILVSGDLPWEKPNKKIFLEACEHLRVPPEQCIMVGDKMETDIVGAARACLGGSVWVPLGDVIANTTSDVTSPDFVLTDITQLPYLLPSNPKTNFRTRPSVLRFLAQSDPDLDDCNSNSSDGS